MSELTIHDDPVDPDAVIDMKTYLTESITQIDQLNALLYEARTQMAVRHHVFAMTDDPRVDEAAAWIEDHLDDPNAFSAAVDVGEVIDKARALAR